MWAGRCVGGGRYGGGGRWVGGGRYDGAGGRCVGSSLRRLQRGESRGWCRYMSKFMSRYICL